MTPELFRLWRKGLGLKQKEAADRLGLKKRMIQYYEKGARDGRPVEIPLAVRLACYAISAGIADFDGTSTRHAETPPRRPRNDGAGTDPVAGRARGDDLPGHGTPD